MITKKPHDLILGGSEKVRSIQPPQCEQGRTHSGFERQRRRHQKSKTGVPVAPK